ncbi:MAG: hypothetical protein AAF409_06110 [Pseudomonadota bacterium]
MTRLIAALMIILATLPARAHEPMTPERMVEIATALDAETQFSGNLISLTVAEIPVLIVFDAVADRMRAITPIRSAEGLSSDDLMRMMQANFDTALDARYSVAKGKLWATFIHPLSTLDNESLISGIGQVANLALSYGSTYSSGALTFGGGDSSGLIEELLKKGERI